MIDQCGNRRHAVDSQDMDKDQEAVLALLLDPETHGSVGDAPDVDIQRIDTHGAVIVLAGDLAYKVKRAVRYPFMDFSTLEKRHQACAREVELNKRTAPDIYLDVVAVTRETDGRLALGGDGAAIDYAVRMRRFDPMMTFDHLAGRDAIGDRMIEDLARAIVDLHDIAEPAANTDEAARLKQVSAGNGEVLETRPDLFDVAEFTRLQSEIDNCLSKSESVLAQRSEAGLVRRCHGDLHLRNIVLIDGRPVVFDALEFDEALATTDLLYDLAFMLMDLWTRGDGRGANLLMNRYLALRNEMLDYAGLAVLPAMLAMRAAIRAKVAALTAAAVSGDAVERAEHEARAFFAAATDFVRPAPTTLVAVGGLSGSGKSTVCRAIAGVVGRSPGAVHLRSDVERKRMLGREDDERLDPDAYSEDVTATVFQRLRDKAWHAISGGQSVIVDAVHLTEDQRGDIRQVADAANVPFVGLWLTAPADQLVGRADARTGDASDATGDIVRRQLDHDLGVIDWQVIDAAGPAAETESRVRRVLDAAGAID